MPILKALKVLAELRVSNEKSKSSLLGSFCLSQLEKPFVLAYPPPVGVPLEMEGPGGAGGQPLFGDRPRPQRFRLLPAKEKAIKLSV